MFGVAKIMEDCGCNRHPKGHCDGSDAASQSEPRLDEFDSDFQSDHASRAADPDSSKPAVPVHVFREVLLVVVFGVVKFGGWQNFSSNLAVSSLGDRALKFEL